MNKSKKVLRLLALALCLIMCLSSTFALMGCNDKKDDEEGYQRNTKLDLDQDVELRIVGRDSTWPALNTVISKFQEIYPNCNIIYENIEQYNDLINVRLRQNEQKIDIFVTSNIQQGFASDAYKDCTLNLLSEVAKEYLDLSKTNAGLLENFKYIGEDNALYAVPYGAEMRGMYVNVTLLNKYGLQIPTNRQELLNCCEVLYDNDYIPLQSSPGTFGQHLLYPYICNSIVNGGNYEEMCNKIQNVEDGISEYFRDAYAFLYDIVEKGYYDYKRVEDELGYAFKNNDNKAMEFLNVKKVGETYVKQDDIGKIAFMPDTEAFKSYLDKVKTDYDSKIQYKFILSPVGENGGCAYMSPADGLAINKNSDNIEWSLEFLNFFFTTEVNKSFAEEMGKIANTVDAMVEFNAPAERTCNVGQVTFRYNLYDVVTPLLTAGWNKWYPKSDFEPEYLAAHDYDEKTDAGMGILIVKFKNVDGPDDMLGICKMTAKKYMIDNGDGTYSPRHTLQEYLDRLEIEFQKYK